MGCGSSTYDPGMMRQQQTVITTSQVPTHIPVIPQRQMATSITIPTVMVQPAPAIQLQQPLVTAPKPVFPTLQPLQQAPEPGQDPEITEAMVMEFQALSVVILELERKNTLGRFDAALLRQTELEKELGDLKQQYDALNVKTMKEYQDFTNLKALGASASIVSYFATQNDFDKQLSKEEEEFLEAKSEQENCYERLVKLQEQNSKLSAEIDDLKKDKNDLMAQYEKQDKLLEEIFGGAYGSSFEDQLEEELDKIEDKHRTIRMAMERWKNAENFIKAASNQLEFACKRFGDVIKIPLKTSTYNVRFQVVGETRRYLLAASRNLSAAQRFVRPVTVPYCDARELTTLTNAINFIYLDCMRRDRQHHAMQVYLTVQARSVMLHKWIKNVIDQRITKDLAEIRAKSLEGRQALRKERMRLMKQKVEETTGKVIDIEEKSEPEFGVEPEPEVTPTSEIAQAEKDDDATNLDEKIEEAKAEIAEEEKVEAEAAVAAIVAEKPALDQLAPAPSRNELFGDLDSIMVAYDQQRQALQSEQESARARQEAHVQEKLRKRRSMKMRLEAQEALM